ncbi:MAG: CPBP family intramembrane metalloprotease [Gracilibacteraceae bacterium]|jgi:membrane protease YdiL (CAAX protease family)|nr:CPBP family intramembrane metalloprotease [Gracilibacteraceae bacterium]
MDESGVKSGREWPEPKWNFWQALFLILIIYSLQFLLGWMGPQPYPGERAGALEYLIRGFGGALITFFLLNIFLRLKKGQPLLLGLGPLHLSHLASGCGAGLILFLLAGSFGYLITLIFGEPALQDFALAVEGSDTWWQLAALALLGGAVVPLQEELLFRGLVYQPLRKLYGPLGGMTRNALFFALIHFDAPRFLPVLIGGFLLCRLFEISQSLWPSIIAHGVWNGLMVALVVAQREFL